MTRLASRRHPRRRGGTRTASALIRDQLRLLRDEVQAALEEGVDDRTARIHLEDVLVRIDRTL